MTNTTRRIVVTILALGTLAGPAQAASAAATHTSGSTAPAAGHTRTTTDTTGWE